MKEIRLFLFLINIITFLWLKFGIVEGIIGGTDAVHGEFKYHASLLANGKFICGAVIVDDFDVLTAAHCVMGQNLKFNDNDYTVVAGIIDMNDKSSRRIEVKVEKLYVPTDYAFIDSGNGRMNINGDIAFLKLAQPLGLDSKKDLLDKVKLPKASQSLETYDYMDPVITGFGYNQASTSTNFLGSKHVSYSHDKVTLKYARTVVIPVDKCQKIFAAIILSSQLCVQLKLPHTSCQGTTCQGDSGGPLIFDGTIIGILSGSSGLYGETGIGSVFTKVGYFLSFIDKARSDTLSKGIRRATYERSRGVFNARKWTLVETPTS